MLLFLSPISTSGLLDIKKCCPLLDKKDTMKYKVHNPEMIFNVKKTKTKKNNHCNFTFNTLTYKQVNTSQPY